MPALALTHPVEHWTCGARAGVLFGTFGIAALFNMAMGRCARVMKANGGLGIIQFEFIGSWEKAGDGLARWRQGNGAGWRAARWALILDYPFLVLYGFGLWTLAGTVAAHAHVRGWDDWANAAVIAGVGFLIAAALDAVENAALLLVLYEKRGPWPLLATACAALKFTLLIVGALVLATTGIAFLASAR
jgi:hypothetical protein